MWIEAMLSRDEIALLVQQLMPLKILLNDDGKRSLKLSEPREIALVAGQGLRVVCRATITWPVLGVGLPVSLNSLGVLLLPKITGRKGHQQLVFRIELEHAELLGAPAWFDARLTDRINKEMGERNVQLSWDFIKTLSHPFALPDMLEPVETFAMYGEHGSVTISADALKLKVDFRAEITRPLPT